MKISALFTDIGGVLLTNGWDHNSRALAVKKFKLDADELNERHHLTFDTFEEGKISFNEYLKRTVFYKKRTFTIRQFKEFMYSQSKPYEEMIDLVCRLKEEYKLRVIAVSNESRELNDHRINKFKLNTFIDAFVSSCFVHLRKPDHDIFRMALDIAQVNPKEIIYIDDKMMFVEVARTVGIHGLHHMNYKSTIKKLSDFGLDLYNK